MLHPETLETYRRMTPSERLRITLGMIRASTPYLFHGSPEQVERKFALLRKQNDDRTRRILTGLSTSGGCDE